VVEEPAAAAAVAASVAAVAAAAAAAVAAVAAEPLVLVPEELAPSLTAVVRNPPTCTT
jgi:hypothetical protein